MNQMRLNVFSVHDGIRSLLIAYIYQNKYIQDHVSLVVSLPPSLPLLSWEYMSNLKIRKKKTNKKQQNLNKNFQEVLLFQKNDLSIHLIPVNKN